MALKVLNTMLHGGATTAKSSKKDKKDKKRDKKLEHKNKKA